MPPYWAAGHVTRPSGLQSGVLRVPGALPPRSYLLGPQPRSAACSLLAPAPPAPPRHMRPSAFLPLPSSPRTHIRSLSTQFLQGRWRPGSSDTLAEVGRRPCGPSVSTEHLLGVGHLLRGRDRVGLETGENPALRDLPF